MKNISFPRVGDHTAVPAGAKDNVEGPAGMLKRAQLLTSSVNETLVLQWVLGKLR